MSRRTLAAAKIPQDWSDVLDQRAQLEGKSRSQLIQEAIAQYLHQPLDQELTLVSLALEIKNLKKQLSMLSLSSPAMVSSPAMAMERHQLNNIEQDGGTEKKISHQVNHKSPENKLFNTDWDYSELVNQFLKQEHLGRQSSKAKFLHKFVKYLSSQLNGSVRVGDKVSPLESVNH